MPARLPAHFLSHGGGPWPYMKDQLGGKFDKLEASLLNLRREVGEAPRAVLVVSGRWEMPEFTVSAAEWPPMVYDYHGFPEHTSRTSTARRARPRSPPASRQCSRPAGSLA